jgi:predicted porin
MPAAAVADEGNVTIYGQARISVDYADNGADASDPGGDINGEFAQIANRDSNFGIKGWEPLGNGLKAIFQFEVQADLDDGGASSGSFFSSGRKSYVGLLSNYGTVVLGIVDSPHRESTDKIDIFANSLADHNTIISNVGDGDGSAEFNRREPNTINYWSPKFNGLSFKGQYRFDEVDGVENDRPSVAVFYENGPLYATAGYELHPNETGGNDADDWKFGVSYAFNATKVAFIYDSLELDDADSVYDRDAWYVSLAHKFGNNTFKIGYAQAQDSDAADDLATLTVDESDDGADFWFVGLSHALSKRTEVFALYATTENDEGGRFGLGNSTNGARVTGTALLNRGQDLDGVSFGMTHKF